MPGNMEVDVTKWSHSQMNNYLDTTIQGFTESQVGHMAWYLGIKHEQMLREKKTKKGVFADKDSQLMREHFSEPADEDIPEQ